MDITKFCAEEDGRYPISKPWIHDGWKYATDGRIIVRQWTDEPDSDHETYDEIKAFFDGPLTDARQDAEVIPTHDGSGTDQYDPACMLDGRAVEEACSKWGKCVAQNDGECKNLKTWRLLDNIKFAGMLWGGRYIKLLNDELPGARYTIIDSTRMHFFLGKVEGVLAAMHDKH